MIDEVITLSVGLDPSRTSTVMEALTTLNCSPKYLGSDNGMLISDLRKLLNKSMLISKFSRAELNTILIALSADAALRIVGERVVMCDSTDEAWESSQRAGMASAGAPPSAESEETMDKHKLVADLMAQMHQQALDDNEESDEDDEDLEDDDWEETDDRDTNEAANSASVSEDLRATENRSSDNHKTAHPRAKASKPRRPLSIEELQGWLSKGWRTQGLTQSHIQLT